MKLPFKKKPSKKGEEERILERLSSLEPEWPEYGTLVSRLKEISEIRSYRPGRWIDGGDVLLAVTNLVGLVLIMRFEKADLLITKAVGFLRRV